MLRHPYILLFVMLFYFSSGKAQFFTNEDCGYTGACNLSNYNNFNKYLQDFNRQKKAEYIIPVKFWVIRNNNGKSKTDAYYLKKQIQYLNYYYSITNTGISFSLRPDYEFIDKSKFLNLKYFLQSPFIILNKKSKCCINVVIVNKLIKNKFLKSRKKKYAGTFNPFSKVIIISRGSSTSTLSHETGHFLGLKHPHRGWKRKWFQEPVSRTKKMFLSKKLMCEKKGDKLCDTPAEPNLTNYTDSKCNYTGWNVKDRYGEIYKPDTHNIMSYTNNRECRNKFTPEQIALMHYTLSENKYEKIWRTDLPENRKYLPDAFEPDNCKKNASEISLNTPQIHSFNKFCASKKKNIADTVDWMYFNIKTIEPQSLKLSLTGINCNFSEIHISVYDNYDRLILEKNMKKPQDIILKDLLQGTYFIKIKNMTSEKICYKLMLHMNKK